MTEEESGKPSGQAMYPFTAKNHSFIMRLWWEDDGESGEWRGSIEHVASNTRIYFRNFETAIQFVSGFMNIEDDVQLQR